jgi:O-acetyl-ADP-ribose deacetylase (regulator of RNase III)
MPWPSIIHGDITRIEVAAIVNAANEWMLGGGGVDGAIHAAAGPELLAACAAVPQVRPGIRCPIGEARITPGFALPARYVIHTVGPRWHGGVRGEPELLAACYRSSLTLAAAHAVRSIAFPAISTGAFGYPLRDACRIAVAECAAFPEHTGAPLAITLVGFNKQDTVTLQRVLAELQSSRE